MRQQSLKMNNNAPVASSMRRISPKMMTMIVLLSVMGILWGRVLLKGDADPAIAGAQGMDEMMAAAGGTDKTPVITIHPVELPVVEGRNDTLSRDPFSISNWTAYDLLTGQQVVQPAEQTTENQDQRVLEKIQKRMTLQAVVCDARGNPLQAYIDDKILTVGTSLTVKEGPDQYELTLTELGKNEAVLKWQDISVTLKMPETFEL